MLFQKSNKKSNIQNRKLGRKQEREYFFAWQKTQHYIEQRCVSIQNKFKKISMENDKSICSITKIMENRALQWYGHVQFMSEYRWPLPKRRSKGRTCLDYIKCVLNQRALPPVRFAQKPPGYFEATRSFAARFVGVY